MGKLVLRIQENEKIQIGEATVQIFRKSGHLVAVIEAPKTVQVERETAKKKDQKVRDE